MRTCMCACASVCWSWSCWRPVTHPPTPTHINPHHKHFTGKQLVAQVLGNQASTLGLQAAVRARANVARGPEARFHMLPRVPVVLHMVSGVWLSGRCVGLWCVGIHLHLHIYIQMPMPHTAVPVHQPLGPRRGAGGSAVQHTPASLLGPDPGLNRVIFLFTFFWGGRRCFVMLIL